MGRPCGQLWHRFERKVVLHVNWFKPTLKIKPSLKNIFRNYCQHEDIYSSSSDILYQINSIVWTQRTFGHLSVAGWKLCIELASRGRVCWTFLYWHCSMKFRHGAGGALLMALLLSFLLTTCTTQESEESLELLDENNTVSTESPVSRIKHTHTHLLFTCQGLKGLWHCAWEIS